MQTLTLITLNVFKQLFSTLLQSAKFLAEGQIKKSIYWFYVRNKISLLCDQNSGHGDSNLKDLTVNGFQELTPLNNIQVKNLTHIFLSHVGSPNQYRDIAEYFESQRNQGFIRSAGIRIDNQSDIVKDIFNQTQIDEIACQYLGLSKEDMCFSATIDSLTKISVNRKLRDGYDDALEYHRDIDSLKFLKVFFYLNDIEIGCGHHELFLKSHRDIPWCLRTIQRHKAETILKKMPLCNLIKVTGKQGFGWAENTTTFHRGTVPTMGDRLLLSFSFNDKKTGPLLCPDYLTPMTN